MERTKPKNLIFIIITSTIISIGTYPSVFIKFGGRNTWLICLISIVIFGILLSFILRMLRKDGRYRVLDISKDVIGKKASKVVVFIFSLGLLLACIESASVTSNSLHTILFIETPVWYCLILFTLTTFYISTKSLSAIITTICIATPCAVISNLFLSILTLRYKTLYYLFPIRMDKSITEYIICGLLFIGSLSSSLVILSILHIVVNKNKKGFNKLIMSSYTFACFLIVWILTGIITGVGPLRASNLYYPNYILAQRIFYEGIGENGEFFSIVYISFVWIGKYLLAFSSLYILWKKVIQNKTIFAAIISSIVFIASYFTARNTYALFVLLKYFQIIFLFTLLIVPISVLVVFYFKTIKKKNLKNK